MPDGLSWRLPARAVGEGANVKTVTELVSGEVQVTEICLVPGSPFDRLPAMIRDMVNAGLPAAVTYRRRHFEHDSMMRELCARNGVVLPTRFA